MRSMRGLRACAHPAARLCDRVRLFRPARAEALRSKPRRSGTLLRRADQRHHRLRGSRGAGPARRHQCRALRARRGRLVPAPRRGLSRRAGRRPDHPRRVRALSHVHVARRVPLSLREDNADLRLTEHGRRLGVVDDVRWDAFCAQARRHRARDANGSDDVGQPAMSSRSTIAERVLGQGHGARVCAH